MRTEPCASLPCLRVSSLIGKRPRCATFSTGVVACTFPREATMRALLGHRRPLSQSAAHATKGGRPCGAPLSIFDRYPHTGSTADWNPAPALIVGQSELVSAGRSRLGAGVALSKAVTPAFGSPPLPFRHDGSPSLDHRL